MLTVGSLFSGIGGLDLGLAWAGMETRWFCEIDEYCQSVLRRHWPGVPVYGDIRDIGRHNLEPVDLICGGFPCQPFSVAGQQRGQEDNRYLWPEMLRVITEVQPTYIIAENVPGIINLALDEVCASLENIGYEVWPLVIPACAVDAPHRRDRVWIMAHAIDRGPQERRPQLAGTLSETRRGRNADTDQCPEATESGAGNGTGLLAHTTLLRREQLGQRLGGEHTQPHRADGVQGQPGGSGCAEDVEDTPGTGWDAAGCQRPREAEGAGPRCRLAGPGRWEPEPPVGVSNDGLSCGVAGLRERWADGSWEYGIPRVAKGIPNRVAKLKALGNAVVPQLAEAIGRLVLAAETEKRSCGA